MTDFENIEAHIMAMCERAIGRAVINAFINGAAAVQVTYDHDEFLVKYISHTAFYGEGNEKLETRGRT